MMNSEAEHWHKLFWALLQACNREGFTVNLWVDGMDGAGVGRSLEYGRKASKIWTKPQ